MLCKSSIMILALSAAVVAKISLGVDVSYRVYNSYTENSVSGGSGQERDNHSTQIGLTPVLGIHPSDLLEISPSFGWYFTSTETEITSTGSASSSSSKSSSSQSSIEPGFGLYFHIINNSNILDFFPRPEGFV